MRRPLRGLPYWPYGPKRGGGLGPAGRIGGTAMVSGGTGPQDELLPELKNREHAKGERRRQRATILYTDVEWARIVAAAAMAGKRPGAWIAEVAHDAARWRLSGLPASREVLVELAEQVRSTRNVLANIGGNLNDVAKHANSTHEVASIREQADAVLRMVRRLVSRTDEQLGQVTEVLRS
ncbi:hypothetical protein [Actinophytocola sp.]|uniref:hypothetical protein n=1 Tax=Actinophytocola sp. TaxID=1872138 RepID=UPI003899C67A